MPANTTTICGLSGEVYPVSYFDRPALQYLRLAPSPAPEPIVVVITKSGDFGLFGISESFQRPDGVYNQIFLSRKGDQINLVQPAYSRKKGLFWLIHPSEARCLLLAVIKASVVHKRYKAAYRWLFWLSFFGTRISTGSWEIASVLRVFCDLHGYNLITKGDFKNLRVKRKRRSVSKIKSIDGITLAGQLVYSRKRLESQGFYCAKF
jgi:hypothetical protein